MKQAFFAATAMSAALAALNGCGAPVPPAPAATFD